MIVETNRKLIVSVGGGYQFVFRGPEYQVDALIEHLLSDEIDEGIIYVASYQEQHIENEPGKKGIHPGNVYKLGARCSKKDFYQAYTFWAAENQSLLDDWIDQTIKNEIA